MKFSDVIAEVRRRIDDEPDSTPNDFRLNYTDDQIKSLIKNAIPELTVFREQWGRTIREDQFMPWRPPDSDDLGINPLLYQDYDNVTIDDILSLDDPAASGYIVTSPEYTAISAAEAADLRDHDFNYRRNIYYRTKNAGYISLSDYTGAVHGETDGGFYARRIVSGIVSVKVDLTLEDVTAGQSVAVDISLDGGSTWVSKDLDVAEGTEIDVLDYPSSSLTVKLTLGSSTGTSPVVHDMSVVIWQADDLEKNIIHVVKLAHALHLQRMWDRASGKGNTDLADRLYYRFEQIKREVAGVFEDGARRPETVGPQVHRGRQNKYNRSYFGR
ncbi:MAG: hypothetical protein JW885_02845 [Deltaproteobacteria bacterium]|nr:hypothetical protein [Candidatus Zymogenaceae bacterium]